MIVLYINYKQIIKCIDDFVFTSYTLTLLLEVKELELLNPQKLRDQFERRIVYNTVEEEDDRLTAAYWLSTPMGDESDQEQDCVSVMNKMSHFKAALDVIFVIIKNRKEVTSSNWLPNTVQGLIWRASSKRVQYPQKPLSYPD